MVRFTAILLLFILVQACTKISLPLQSGGEDDFSSLKQYIKESSRLNEYHFGIQLFDLQNQEIAFAHNDDQFFTPASVNKWLTLYVAKQYLDDSIAWMNIYNVNDTTVYQPLGDPSFLHPKLNTEPRILDFFGNQVQDTIYWNDQHFKEERFGPGWAWDDYTYSYQPEKSAFPIQSNLLRVEGTETSPSFIPSITLFDFDEDYPKRQWDENIFHLNAAKSVRWIPLRADPILVKHYLVEQLKVYQHHNKPLDPNQLIETIYSLPSDTLFKVLMQQSDNHIGEQLLLQVSQKILNRMDTKTAIRYLQDHDPLLSLRQFYWEDGSGLSRYNMSKPSAIVNVINALADSEGIDWLQEVLPAGGVSGTISNNYIFDQPRVYAKTGTLRHNHNLAGIIQANSGKWYSFSIMNNHIPGSARIAKHEMENIVKLIVELY